MGPWWKLIALMRDRGLKMMPVIILSALSMCAFLTVITGLAGYYFFSVFIMSAEPDSKTDRESVRGISPEDMYQRVAMLQDELDVLRDHNRHLWNISRRGSNPSGEMRGMGGSPSSFLSDERTTDILTRKVPPNEIETHIRSLHESITHEKQLTQDLMAEMERNQIILAHLPMTRPTRGWISSRYGWRNSPFTGEREYHHGIDVASGLAEPVFAPADGVVKKYYNSSDLGNVMIIDHGYGIVTRYGHLLDQVALIGQEVGRGDRIALMGNTGRSTGPHLHYELFIQGQSVNPQRYMLK